MKDPDISDLLNKARESLGAAECLLRGEYAAFSASRSYYAMFYAAEAMLLSKDLTFSKHKAVISAFGREFVKSGLVSPSLHRYISEAFEIRQAGDYGPTSSISEEEAALLIKQASEFIQVVEGYLGADGYITNARDE